MAGDDRDKNFLERSAESIQESVERAGPAAGASYGLIGAIIVLGAIGYAIDVWLETSPWALVIGLLLGIIVGMWGLAKIVWRK